MRKSTLIQSALSICVLVFLGLVALPIIVHAADVPGSAVTSTPKRTEMVRFVDLANKEIDRRVKNLTALGTRISEAKKISPDAKTSLRGTIQTEITNLETLKAKINADTDLATLKADVQTITKSYRIYALIMPQIAILAHADRVLTLGDMMTALAAKLQTRIADAKSAGTDVTFAQTKLEDLNAKIADAKAQAQASMALVASLMPDNGDRTKMQSNIKALQDARTKLKVGQTALETARKDAVAIAKIVKGFTAANASSTKQRATTTEQ